MVGNSESTSEIKKSRSRPIWENLEKIGKNWEKLGNLGTFPKNSEKSCNFPPIRTAASGALPSRQCMHSACPGPSGTAGRRPVRRARLAVLQPVGITDRQIALLKVSIEAGILLCVNGATRSESGPAQPGADCGPGLGRLSVGVPGHVPTQDRPLAREARAAAHIAFDPAAARQRPDRGASPVRVAC
jgi:hypothetical protein